MRRNNLATKLENSVSRIPIESVFTHHDINKNLPQHKSLGYTANYPTEWLNIHSDKKMIGIRRLEMFPTSHVFEMGYKVYSSYYAPVFDGPWVSASNHHYPTKPLVWEEGVFELDRPIFSEEFEEQGNEFIREVTDKITIKRVNAYMYKVRYDCKYVAGDEQPYKIDVYYTRSANKYSITICEHPRNLYSIIDENETTEILSKMFDVDINPDAPEQGRNYHVRCDYNSSVGRLQIQAHNALTEELKVSGFDFGGIKIKERRPFNNRGAIELLKFLNQEVNLQNYFYLQVPRFDIIFEDNVWNRKQAMFHASFRNCNRNYIGLRKDFMNPPTKVYEHTGDSHFYLKFSTDGVNYFLPRYNGFLLELIYILNINNVEINR